MLYVDFEMEIFVSYIDILDSNSEIYCEVMAIFAISSRNMHKNHLSTATIYFEFFEWETSLII